MKMPIRNSCLSNWFLALAVIYFSLIYPYTHFHRSHYVHVKAPALEVHTFVAGSDGLPSRHSDHRDHHTIDQHVGIFCKTRLQNNSDDLITKPVLESIPFNIDLPLKCNGRAACDLAAPPIQFLYYACADTRSPPQFLNYQS